jgi:DNA-binding Lrp family transcriptional regulator
MREILELLKKDARLTPLQISEMTGVPVKKVESVVKKAEKDHTILRYKTVIDWSKLEDEEVLALIELKVIPQRNVGFDAIARRIYKFPQVQAVYLASGAYDFALLISGKTMHDIARFISEKLASLETVQGTVTHFILKKYKEDGEILEMQKENNRLPITP